MSNIFDTENAMPSLTYQEKSLYGTLVVDLIVYLPYFLFVRHASLGSVVGVVTLIILVQIVVQSIIAALSRNRITDERDRLIGLYGYRAGYFALVTGVLGGLMLLWGHAVAGMINPNHAAIHFINVLFLVLVIAELVKTITQLIAYRRAN